MKALRFHGQRDVRVEDVPEPELRPGTVKIKVDWCGICGSDLHEYLAGPIFIPSEQPHPLTGETAPVIMGHEFAGQVVDADDGTADLAPGDNVAVEPILRDNDCPVCRRGSYNLCPNVGFHGLSGGGGGLSEFTVVPSYMVHKLPEGMGTDLGALVEPMAVAFHGVDKAGAVFGRTALVMGAGPIGLATLLCLRAAGASLVAVAEVADERKRKAAELGASAVIDPGEQDLAAETEQLTGDGFDAVFECAGVPATFKAALESVRPEGVVVNLAIWEKPTEIQLNDLVFSEAKVTAALAYAGDYPATIALIGDNRLDAAEMITKRVPLDDVVAGGFEELVEHKDRNVKILVQPSA